MLIALLLVSGIAVAAVIALVLRGRAIRSLRRQLAEHLAGQRDTAITVELADPQMQALTIRIDDLRRHAREAVITQRRQAGSFRAAIADVSHDLRTPLTSVRGHLQLLERTALDAEQVRYVEVIGERTADLTALIGRMHELTALVDRAPELDLQEVDLAGFVEEQLLGLTDQISGAGLAVEAELEPVGTLLTDPHHVQRIVQNLLGNAVIHGEGTLRLRTEQGATEARLIVANEVADPAQIDLEAIFERFRTGDRSRSGRRTGLGLAIVQALAEQLGGTVQAELEDHWIRFTVELPRAPHGDASA